MKLGGTGVPGEGTGGLRSSGGVAPIPFPTVLRSWSDNLPEYWLRLME